jgi:RNA polymerase sigma-70 factor (ECF subfamily)
MRAGGNQEGSIRLPRPEEVWSDASAFDDIYRSEAPALVRFLRSKLKSQCDAEDLAHEALVRFLRAADQTQIQTPQAYLRRIATNLLIDRAERGATKITDRSVELADARELAAPDDQHRDLVGREELEHFNEVLRKLKPRTLKIFLLSRVEGYTYKQIARKLGMTVWGVKWHMLRAIEHVDRHRGER